MIIKNISGAPARVPFVLPAETVVNYRTGHTMQPGDFLTLPNDPATATMVQDLVAAGVIKLCSSTSGGAGQFIPIVYGDFEPAGTSVQITAGVSPGWFLYKITDGSPVLVGPLNDFVIDGDPVEEYLIARSDDDANNYWDVCEPLSATVFDLYMTTNGLELCVIGAVHDPCADNCGYCAAPMTNTIYKSFELIVQSDWKSGAMLLTP